MSKKLVACYKVHRGGEWFEDSLESVRDGTDGAVVVFSEDSWIPSGLPENCREPLLRFTGRYPGYPVITRSGDFRRGEPQYDLALATIRGEFGEDAAALIVDSDEVWEPGDVAKARSAIEAQPDCHYFRAGLYTYLRSPLYQVWPPGPPHCCVAIQHCRPQEINIRFSTQEQGPYCALPDVWVHHFSYVRENPEDICLKFQCTSSQERKASKNDWLETVWDHLPLGTNLHMTPGFERVWQEIKVLTAPPVPLPVFCDNLIEGEDLRWRNALMAIAPDKTIVPVPIGHDREKYPEFDGFVDNSALLHTRLKMTYLEALVLGDCVTNFVPGDGLILEIGSGDGGSSAVMAMAAPGAELWAVDPFEPYDEQNVMLCKNVTEGHEDRFWQTARHYDYANRVRLLKKDSARAASECPGAAFDLVLVDGNHTEAIVKKDLELYWPKVKPGGILLAHDFTTRFPGVIAACQGWGVPYAVFAGTSLAYARKTR